MARMRVYRFNQAFLPFAVTSAIGLPQHVANADLLIVANNKTGAGELAALHRVNPGSRYQFVLVARLREVRALSRAGLLTEPAVFALPSIDRPGDGHLVRIERDRSVTVICPVTDLRMRERDDVELVS